jgi:hypothetical protein
MFRTLLTSDVKQRGFHKLFRLGIPCRGEWYRQASASSWQRAETVVAAGMPLVSDASGATGSGEFLAYSFRNPFAASGVPIESFRRS